MYWKNLFKVLSTLLVTFIATLAVSASAAQATTWTIKENGSTTLHLKVVGSEALGEIRTNSHIVHCESGTLGYALVILDENHEVSEMVVVGVKTKCFPLGQPSCTVSSPGAKVGEILSEASGPLATEGGSVYATLEGKEAISTLVYSGALCPLPKEETLTGSMKLTISKAAEEAKVHAFELNEAELFLGEENAFLDGKEKAPAIGGELQGKEGATFSITSK